MVRFRSLAIYCLFFALLLLSGCAQVVAPSGGPKDKVPPKPLSFLPENKSLHFASKKILIKFNKYIQLKDLTGQLVVSPPLKYFPVALIKSGKILQMQLKDTLHENTTYTFNFGNAIADINEGNILYNFQYVFSTGDYLDSLKLTGKVINSFSQDPQKEALVMLYADQSDSAPYKVLPSYCGRTDAGGNYKIENIKNGTYRLFCLSKSDNGYLYHAYSQSIGFNSKPIDLESNDTVNLSLFMEEDKRFHFIKARAVDRGKIMLVFSAPADSISIIPLNLAASSAKPYTLLQYGANHDTAYYWINNPALDSLRFIIAKNNKNIDTTVVYNFPNKIIQSKKNTKPIPLKITSNISGQSDYDYHRPILLKSTYPLMKYNLSLIYLTQGKDTIRYKVDSTGLPFQLALKPNLISDSSYRLFVASGAFTDVFGLVNDTVLQRFKVLEPTFFGSLQLNLKFEKQASYIIQLLDDQGKVYTQDIVNNSKSLNYEALPPGNYRIRAIEDEDKNGKWTTGNYLGNLQPEKVFYYPQALTIRSNWDLTQDWLVK